MDISVVTLTGNSFASRVGASILSSVGIKELITSSTKEYQELGIELAIKPNKLAKLKIILKSLFLNQDYLIVMRSLQN